MMLIAFSIEGGSETRKQVLIRVHPNEKKSNQQRGEQCLQKQAPELSGGALSRRPILCDINLALW
jgi:hypothetical protein